MSGAYETVDYPGCPCCGGAGSGTCGGVAYGIPAERLLVWEPETFGGTVLLPDGLTAAGGTVLLTWTPGPFAPPPWIGYPVADSCWVGNEFPAGGGHVWHAFSPCDDAQFRNWTYSIWYRAPQYELPYNPRYCRIAISSMPHPVNAGPYLGIPDGGQSWAGLAELDNTTYSNTDQHFLPPIHFAFGDP